MMLSPWRARPLGLDIGPDGTWRPPLSRPYPASHRVVKSGIQSDLHFVLTSSGAPHVHFSMCRLGSILSAVDETRLKGAPHPCILHRTTLRPPSPPCHPCLDLIHHHPGRQQPPPWRPYSPMSPSSRLPAPTVRRASPGRYVTLGPAEYTYLTRVLADDVNDRRT